jgi:hypothetical protein
MKTCLILLLLLSPVYFAQAQQATPLPHGMIFGDKPDTANAIEVTKLKKLMSGKTRIYTVVKAKYYVLHKRKAAGLNWMQAITALWPRTLKTMM